MPRRNSNNGNKANPINANNLEQVKKLLEEIGDILKKDVATTTNNLSIEKYLEDNERLLDIVNELNSSMRNYFKTLSTGSPEFRKDVKEQVENVKTLTEMYEKHLEYRAKENIALEDETERIRQQKNSSLKAIRDLEKELDKHQDTTYSNLRKGKWSFENLGESIFGGKITKSDRTNREKFNEEYEKIRQEVVKKYKDEGKYEAKYLKDMQSDIDEKVKGLNISIDKNTVKLEVASTIVDSVGKSFKYVLNTFLKDFESAIDKQSQIYEDTFQNISTRTGTTRGEYFSNQSATNSNLISSGLYNNINVTDVQEMWNSLANTGMNEQDMFETALENVVTKNIVPYLDTSSQEFNLLNSRLNGQFVKDIRGINKANLDIAGNNYVTEKLLNNIISEVQPMSDVAEQELVKGSEELSGYLNTLMASTEDGGAGLSYDQAMSIVTQINKARTQGYDMLTNGSTSDKMFITELMQNNVDLEDISQWNDAASIYTGIGQTLTSWGPGYSGGMTNAVVQGSLNNSLGLDYSSSSAFQKMTDAGITPYDKLSTDLTDEQVSQYAKEAYEDFNNDENQTQKDLQTTTVENIATNVAIIQERLGVWGEGIVKAVEGVTTGLVTYFGGKFLTGKLGSWLSGMATSSAATKTATTSMLATGGGIALGTIAGVAAIGAISTAVADGMRDKEKEQATENASIFSADFTDYGDSAGATSAGAIYSYGQQMGRASNQSVIASFARNFGSNVLQSTSNLFNLNGYDWDDPSKANSEKWDRTIGKIKGSINEDLMKWMIVDYALAMLDAGNDSSIIPSVLGSGITIDGIKTFIHQQEEENSNEYLNLYSSGIAKLKDLDLYPVGPSRVFSDYVWTTEDMKNWGAYRQGLDEVPYDNYPALLHEGEAVLTATTADELRGLIDEYRQTSEQSVNFDTIIQNQTTALVEKMEQIIQTISTNADVSQVLTTTKNTSDNKVWYNMNRMKSTKAF